MRNFDNKFIGTFDTETEVLQKIDELKAEGYAENDMYVMTSDSDQISMVRGRTDVDVDVQSSGGGWMDKFMGFLSGEEPTRGAFDKMGLDAGEADRYHNEVKNGKILLYVDRDYGTHYETEGYVDDAAVASPGLTVDTNESNNTAYNTNRNLVEDDDRLDTGRIDSGIREEEVDEVVVEKDRTPVEPAVDPVVETDRERVAETEEERLRLHEERLNVGKERVESGEVNVGKHTVEERQHVEVPVEHEEVVVERRPVNEETQAGVNDRAYDDNEEIHIPLTEERVEVSKKDVVGEEIVVGKRKVQDTEVVDETVRHEEADIEGDVEIDEAERLRRENERKGRL
ncbi:YsnF/AvaK domain-containing protein [Planococcus lenghuensis]|uniref:Stress response protein YsnF n=1 Tax=Planococcus lenghuensis TaxID=2213202 RepID=A0A1Q2L1X6_9BACL|nr:YsnF/AvaK domain-containing protein [Planococcus lenghuensis]AQQ54416.1 hypothetical protein B0X71_15780 [Planococcus lenghuensis]